MQISVLVALISCNIPEGRSGIGFQDNLVGFWVSRALKGS
jgi:hypothetical protein